MGIFSDRGFFTLPKPYFNKDDATGVAVYLDLNYSGRKIAGWFLAFNT